MGLFDKKFCDVCGGKIGLLGNRKLADGNLCKDCAEKLSPWFEERRASTVEDIKKQLELREKNRELLKQFHPTKTIGHSTRVLLDESAGVFVVTDATDLAKANPDLVALIQVRDASVQVRENHREVYREVRDAEGKYKKESYTPRRFQYSYDFIITILLEHPYLEQISFHLNSRVVDVPYNELDYIPTGGLFATTARPTTASVREGSTTPPPVEVRMANQTYADYASMADEIVARLSRRPTPMQGAVDPAFAETLARAQAVATAAAVPAAPAAGPWICPACGGQNNGKFCEYCGTPRP